MRARRGPGSVIPSPLAAPVIAVGFFAFLGQVFQGTQSELAWLWPTVIDPSASFAPRGWHIAYVVGLAFVLGALAVLRSGGRWHAILSLIAGAALAVGAGILQVVTGT